MEDYEWDFDESCQSEAHIPILVFSFMVRKSESYHNHNQKHKACGDKAEMYSWT